MELRLQIELPFSYIFVHGLWDMEAMLEYLDTSRNIQYSCDAVVYLDISKNILSMSKKLCQGVFLWCGWNITWNVPSYSRSCSCSQNNIHVVQWMKIWWSWPNFP